MQSSRKLPLIFGTPFLATAGATLDYTNKRAVLLHIDEKVYYLITPTDTFLCGTSTYMEGNPMGKKVNDDPTSGPHSLEDHKDDEGISDGFCLKSIFEEPNSTCLVVKSSKLAKAKPEESKNPTLSLHPLKYVDGEI